MGGFCLGWWIIKGQVGWWVIFSSPVITPITSTITMISGGSKLCIVLLRTPMSILWLCLFACREFDRGPALIGCFILQNPGYYCQSNRKFAVATACLFRQFGVFRRGEDSKRAWATWFSLACVCHTGCKNRSSGYICTLQLHMLSPFCNC